MRFGDVAPTPSHRRTTSTNAERLVRSLGSGRGAAPSGISRGGHPVSASSVGSAWKAGRWIGGRPDKSTRMLPLVGENGRGTQARKAQVINGSRTKRSVDIVGAGLLIALLLPMLLLIALLIRLDSRGPALFRQQRYGVGRRVFTMYKFRSMTVMEASGAFVQAKPGDYRVTRVGRILRRTSLDELPQLLNVVMGDMSLVGPRPHAVAMDDAYSSVVARYEERHLVRPGLTGLAQICGYRGPTETLAKIEDRVWRDRVYIRRWSFLLDVKILARTPASLLNSNAL